MAAPTGTLDPSNCSTTPLAGAAVFTGAPVDTSGYGQVAVSAYSNVAGTLALQFSSDGANWDFSTDYAVSAATAKSVQLAPKGRYFRVRYTNGGVAQASFRLSAVLKNASAPPSDVIPTTPVFTEYLPVRITTGSAWAPAPAGADILATFDGTISGSTAGVPTAWSGTDTGIIDVRNYRYVMSSVSAHTVSSNPGTSTLTLFTNPYFAPAAINGTNPFIASNTQTSSISGNSYRASLLLGADIPNIGATAGRVVFPWRTPYIRAYLEYTASNAANTYVAVMYRVWGFYN